MNPKKTPVCGGGDLNTNGNGQRLGGVGLARQRRSAGEIAFAYAMRTLPLLTELRLVGHRPDAYRNGGPRT